MMNFGNYLNTGNCFSFVNKFLRWAVQLPPTFLIGSLYLVKRRRKGFIFLTKRFLNLIDILLSIFQTKNKTMKKLFLFALTGFFFAVSANAQIERNTNPSQKVQSDSAHHHHRGEMMDQLNLSPDQKSQMKSLRESNKQQRDEIKNDASLTQDQKRARMKELYKSQSEKMNSILTPDQQAKRNTYIKKMRTDKKMNGGKKWRGNKHNKPAGNTQAS